MVTVHQPLGVEIDLKDLKDLITQIYCGCMIVVRPLGVASRYIIFMRKLNHFVHEVAVETKKPPSQWFPSIAR